MLTSGAGSLPRFLERCLTAAALAATVAALLLVGQNQLAPLQQPWTFGLVLWAWFLAFYLALALPLALVLSWAGLRSGLGWLPAAGLRLGLVLFLASAGIENRRALLGLLALEGPDRYTWLLPAAAGLAAIGLLAAALPLSRRGPLRLLALACFAATFAGLAPQAKSAAATPAAPLHRPGASRTPLLVVGVDGADWRLLEPLLARGELPNFERLRRNGAWGPLRTIRPTLSPAIWTSIATGRTPEHHGIRGFTRPRLAGVDDTLPRLVPVERLGYRELMAWLRFSGQLFESPIVSGMRRAPAFWNIATAHASPVSVLHWWGTWPAEPVLGYVVSERAYHAAEEPAVTFPEELRGELADLRQRRDDVTLADLRFFMELTPQEFEAMRARDRASAGRDIEKEMPAFLGLFETTRRAALHLIDKGRRRFGQPTDLLVLFRIVDQTCHSSLRFSELVEDHLGAAPDRILRFGRVVSAAYRAMDRALGELLAAVGAANVVVLSDHGFTLEGDADKRSYNHRSAPDGIFLAAGPALRAGRVDGLGIYDVLPLLLYLKDLPLARRLEGRLDEALIAESHLAAHPVLRVARYDDVATRPPLRGAREVDREMLERLRALGYLE